MSLTQGRRVLPAEDGTIKLTQPGDYGLAGWGDWYVRLPNWTDEAWSDKSSKQVWLGEHKVVEHEDGTITVDPSILWDHTCPGGEKTWWHGFLERGVWRSV